jgi:hypothetical protein
MQLPAAPPQQADAAVEELARWVEWLVEAYSIEHWPECWKSHPGLVLEAAALQQWHAAAKVGGAAANELFLWHDGLARFRDRLGLWVRRCAGGCSRSDLGRRDAPSSEDVARRPA